MSIKAQGLELEHPELEGFGFRVSGLFTVAMPNEARRLRTHVVQKEMANSVVQIARQRERERERKGKTEDLDHAQAEQAETEREREMQGRMEGGRHGWMDGWMDG